LNEWNYKHCIQLKLLNIDNIWKTPIFSLIFNYFLMPSFLLKNKKEAEKVEVKYEKLKNCFGHGSRTGPHQSEIWPLTHWIIVPCPKQQLYNTIQKKIKKFSKVYFFTFEIYCEAIFFRSQYLPCNIKIFIIKESTICLKMVCNILNCFMKYNTTVGISFVIFLWCDFSQWRTCTRDCKNTEFFKNGNTGNTENSYTEYR
jgi:hypothetical protein